MPAFAFEARDAQGARVRGTLDAASEAAAFADLQARGLAPVAVQERAEARIRVRVSGRAVSASYRQLSDLLRAGVPLLRSLRLLGRGKSNPRLAEVWNNVAEAVQDGERLAEAMAAHPRVFADVHVAMVRAGERGGFLDEVFARLSAFLESQAEMRSKVIGNMIYPVILLVVGAGIVLAALIFFVPRFKKFQARGGLPPATEALMWVSDLLIERWPLLLILCAAAIAGAWWVWHRPALRRRVADAQLRLPVWGGLVRAVCVARFTRVLGTLLANGIPLLSAMQISRDAAGHPALEDAVDRAVEAVRAGEPLAQPLGQSGFFEEDVTEMVAVGESANNL
ncbi:MAG: type II secretion system F family protein, partial [Phycisphaerae bacterium]|nr:type II secretion system F family protein [Phycisphaerae bacterium]